MSIKWIAMGRSSEENSPIQVEAKMKIAHIIWSFEIGGSQSMLANIVNEQSNKHTVALVIMNSLVEPNLLANVSSRVTIITINRKPGSRNVLDIIRLNMQLRNFQPDIVHCHNLNLIKLLMSGRFKKVVTIHNTRLNPEERCLKRYSKVFAISKAVLTDIIERCEATKLVVVYNGIDFSKIDSGNNCHNDSFRMVQISRLYCRQKAQDILLKALHSVVYQYGIKNVHLDFIGDGVSDDYLKAMTKELKLDSYCSFLGEQHREFINANLKNYNLLIQPSNFEGFGLTVVEGMAAKIPVLVSNIDGPMEIIQCGKFGYCFEVGNAEDCAKKITKIMSEYNKHGLEENIDRSYRYALEHFDIKKTATDYITHYKELT